MLNIEQANAAAGTATAVAGTRAASRWVDKYCPHCSRQQGLNKKVQFKAPFKAQFKAGKMNLVKTKSKA